MTDPMTDAPPELAALARRYCLQNAVQHGGRCQPRGLVGRIMGAHPEHRGNPGAVVAALDAAGAAVNAMTPEAQRETLAAEAPELLEVQKKERRTGLKELPGDTSRVVLRFAPNPNGPLSLGHSRGLAILAEYRRAHDATLVLRFDDTDPQVKPPLMDDARGWDGYAMIREDFRWLTGTDPDREVVASDRIGVYHDAARDLIARGGAYVCTCDAEAFRALKAAGEACPCRNQAPEATRAAFDGMVDGPVGAGEAVLRIRTDITHKDPALRDWTAFRVVADGAVHPRAATGDIPDHRCWPLLDFESAVEDHLQGVTHVIRGKDLMDSTKKQRFLYEHMGWTYPETLYWGRVAMHEFGKFSTSMMRREIEAGTFTGWDDPRLPTLGALRRRGFDPGALSRFWVGLGITEKDISVSMENIEAEDAKAHDDAAPRRFFVPRPRRLALAGHDGSPAHPLDHPSHPDRGTRTLAPGDAVWVPGDEATARFRLKDLGNVDVAGDGDTATFTGAAMDRGVRILQWLPANAAAPFVVLRPGQPGADGVPTLLEETGYAETDVAALVGRVIQFERYGFVRVEAPDRAVWLHA